MPTILIAEDDTSIRTAMVDLLSGMGYDIIEASNGKDAMDFALNRQYSLLLLDVIMPYYSGLDVLKALRKGRPGQAVIILSAKGEENDRIAGLHLGADDYMVKPFSVKELLARINAVLRRSHERISIEDTFSISGAVIDLGKGQITLDSGGENPISEKEIELLRYLYQNNHRFVSKDELLQEIWHVNPLLTASRTVEMHMANLRKKLPETESIISIRGKGYQIITS